MAQTQRSILLLSPQFYGAPGGVQTYMRRLREILTSYSQARGFQVYCLSLVDAGEEPELHSSPVAEGSFEGCQGKKLAFVLKVIGYVVRHPDSLVIVGHLGPAPVAWVLKRLGLIRSYILVLYGVEAWKKARWLNRQAARGAVCIVAITQHTAREFGKHNGVSTERFRVIPPSISEAEVKLPANNQGNQGNQGNQESVDEPRLKVLTVARLSSDDRDKGIDILIKAVAKVWSRSHGTRIHLTVVGDGDDRRRLKDVAVDLDLDSQIISFLGAVPNEELQKLYQECDVFAMPSKKEGFGIVFLEAMRYGKPCVGGNHGGTPEVISHGVDGYLVNYGDVEQIAQYLLELSRSPKLRQKMGLNSYKKVKARYLLSHMRDKWFSLLDEFICSK